jgi:aldehyde dehydrogenase (NAD+)
MQVGGKRCEPLDSGGAFNNLEPRTGRLLCQVASSGPQEVDRAVAAARAAFPAWAALSGQFSHLFIQDF